MVSIIWSPSRHKLRYVDADLLLHYHRPVRLLLELLTPWVRVGRKVLANRRAFLPGAEVCRYGPRTAHRSGTNTQGGCATGPRPFRGAAYGLGKRQGRCHATSCLTEV